VNASLAFLVPALAFAIPALAFAIPALDGGLTDKDKRR
jgi:hypothetical protein